MLVPVHIIPLRTSTMSQLRYGLLFLLLLLTIPPTTSVARTREELTADSTRLVQWLYYTNRSDDSIGVNKKKKKEDARKQKATKKTNVAKAVIAKKTYVKVEHETRVALSDSQITLGSSQTGTIILAPRIQRPKRSAPILKWIIGIATDTLGSNTIVKVFSGGEMPPSGIQWSGETSEGGTVDTGHVYVRMVLLTTEDMFEQTPWKRIHVLRQP